MKIALLGYGKMGKMIEEIIQREGQHQVVLKISSSNKDQLNKANLRVSDVALDFSAPVAVIKNVTECFEAKIPVVVGTTGWYDDLNKVKKVCEDKNGSMVYAGNFSVGFNTFFELNRELAALMKSHKEYEPSIREVHHEQKKDSPSGTAIFLANDIIKMSPAKHQWVNHESNKSDDLIILSRREGNIVGIHEVEYVSPSDKIEIRHVAFNREGFAQGALLAAAWIKDKKGLFKFSEILDGDQ